MAVVCCIQSAFSLPVEPQSNSPRRPLGASYQVLLLLLLGLLLWFMASLQASLPAFLEGC